MTGYNNLNFTRVASTSHNDLITVVVSIDGSIYNSGSSDNEATSRNIAAFETMKRWKFCDFSDVISPYIGQSSSANASLNHGRDHASHTQPKASSSSRPIVITKSTPSLVPQMSNQDTTARHQTPAAAVPKLRPTELEEIQSQTNSIALVNLFYQSRKYIYIYLNSIV